MRILRLNSVSGPTGGVETYIDNTDKALSELGHFTKTITLTTEKELSATPQNVSVRITSSSLGRVFHDILTSNDLINRLNLEYRKFHPDLIHLHHFRIGFKTVYKFLTSVDTPAVFTAHDALAVCPLSTLVKPGDVICEGGVSLRCGFTGCKIHSHLPYELMLSRSFKKLSESKIKTFICPSYSIMNYLISNGFDPSVHLPSFSYFNPNVKSSEPRYDDILLNKNIGFIGRLEWYKGIDDLIKGFSIFSRTHPEFTLQIAGSGPFREVLKSLVYNLNLEKKVIFMGTIGKEQREEFYRSLFCNVVPSKYWENFALSAQESLLRGVPTIGTRIGGIPEIIQDGITGFTVPISSPEQIAKKLEDILQNKNNKIVELMKNGRSFILNNLTPEKHISGLLDIYKKVLNNERIPNGFDENKLEKRISDTRNAE